MLNDSKTFEELLTGLQNINPAIPLPLVLRPKLWNGMLVVPEHKEIRVLEQEGEKPKNAYYVVRGYVIVCGYDESTDEYIWRIYQPGTIVALNCFMHRKRSIYTIKTGKKALVWSVGADVMKEIYQEMDGMREFALQTAAAYDERMERGRNILLTLDIDDRVRKFYKYYPGLLPSRTSLLPDGVVASFLAITKPQLRRTRSKLISAGLLNIKKKIVQ